MTEELSPFENLQWMSVLKSPTANQMYRRQMRLRMRRPDVLKFLLQEGRFPRAFRHTLCEVKNCLQDLPDSDKPLRLIIRFERKLMRVKPRELRQEKPHDFIDDLLLGLIGINNSITAACF